MRKLSKCPSIQTTLVLLLATSLASACGKSEPQLRESPHAERLDAIRVLLPTTLDLSNEEIESDPLVPVMQRFRDAFFDGLVLEDGWLDLAETNYSQEVEHMVDQWIVRPGATQEDLSDELWQSLDGLMEWHEQNPNQAPLLSTGAYSLIGIPAWREDELKLLSAFFPSTHPLWEAMLHSAQYVWDTTVNVGVSSSATNVWDFYDGLLMAEGSAQGWSSHQRYAPQWEAGLYRLFLTTSWRIQPVAPVAFEDQFLAEVGVEEFNRQQARVMDMLEEYDWEALQLAECLKILNRQSPSWAELRYESFDYVAMHLKAIQQRFPQD